MKIEGIKDKWLTKIQHSAVKTKINICFLMIIALTKNWISSGVIFEIGIAFKNFSKKFGKMWKKERMKS